MNLRTEIARIRTEVDRLKVATADDPYAEDPAALMEAAGMEPDPWQRDLLMNVSNWTQTLLLITRQGGKTTAVGTKALHRALYSPGSLVLVLAPALRQSQELFAKVVSLYRAAGEPVAVERLGAEHMSFIHGSRIVALPGTEKTVRGFSGVDLLIIDEAARVLDDLYYSVRPMLAVSGGELVALSTPWGKRGFFYDEWTNGGGSFQRIRVTAKECPRISPEFLKEERRRMPDLWFRSEYMCEFTDTVDQYIPTEYIERARRDDIPMLDLSRTAA